MRKRDVDKNELLFKLSVMCRTMKSQATILGNIYHKIELTHFAASNVTIIYWCLY